MKSALILLLLYSLSASADLSRDTDRDFSEDIKNNACVHFLDGDGNPTLECGGVRLDSEVATKLQQAYSPELQPTEFTTDVTADATITADASTNTTGVATDSTSNTASNAENVPTTNTP